ncbi:hypothetical protein CRG98_049811, partial [Punica granatum]
LVLKPELPQLAHNSRSLSSFRPPETRVGFGAETPQLSRPLAHGSKSWIPSPRGRACASPSRPAAQRRSNPAAASSTAAAAQPISIRPVDQRPAQARFAGPIAAQFGPIPSGSLPSP